MAITGTFGADFSAFVSEVQRAQESLVTFKGEADAAQGSIAALGGGLDTSGIVASGSQLSAMLQGVKVDGDAVSAWMAHTVGDAEAAGAAFKVVGDEGAGVEASMKDVTAEGDSTINTLKNLAGAVGIGFSVGAVVAFGQAMLTTAGEIQHVADATGLTTDRVQGLTAAAAQSGTTMGTFSGAIGRLQQGIGSGDAGLIKATKELGLEWTEIRTLSPYDAFLTYADALGQVDDQNRRAALGNDVFGKSWKDLASAVKTGVQDVADAAPKMTQETIATLNALDARIQTLKTSIKVAAAEVVASFVPGHFDAANEAARRAALGLDLAAAGLAGVAPPAVALLEPFRAVTLTTAQLGIEQRKLAADVERNTAALAAAAERATAFRAWQAAFAEVSSAGATLQGTLDGIDGVLVELVREGLDAGAAQGALATTYALTATQVRAVAEAYRIEQTEAKRSLEATEALTTALSHQIVQRALETQATLQADRYSRAHYEKLAADAAKAYTDASAAGDQYTVERLDQLRREAEGAAENLTNWQTLANEALHGVKGAADQARDAVRGVNTEVETAAQQLARMRGGSWGAPVGESRPLAGAIPGSAYDAIGRWAVPGAGGILTMQTGAVTINYPIMDDPQARDAIGRVVGDAILERVTRGGATV